MAIARSHLIPEHSPGHFHLISRCVRRAWLCGDDPYTGFNYSHRKKLILQRMEALVGAYAIEINAYAIMANHFHLAVYVDPTQSQAWSDLEVTERWVEAYPPRVAASKLKLAKAFKIEHLRQDPQMLMQRRKDLGSISHFMKNLKGPVARHFNLEDNCTGAFWEGRFKSIALEDNEQVIDCLRYIDLNPHKAGIANSLDECELTTVEARIKAAEAKPKSLDQPMRAYLSGIGSKSDFGFTTRHYLRSIEQVMQANSKKKLGDQTGMLKQLVHSLSSVDPP